MPAPFLFLLPKEIDTDPEEEGSDKSGTGGPSSGQGSSPKSGGSEGGRGKGVWGSSIQGGLGDVHMEGGRARRGGHDPEEGHHDHPKSG